MIEKISEPQKEHDVSSMASSDGLNRRRLIKAAATVTPVILTLRSGATQAVVSACTASPVRYAKAEGTYCSSLDENNACINTPLNGEIINDPNELCGSPAYLTDANSNIVTYCPENAAIYSANAVASLRCYDQPWNPN